MSESANIAVVRKVYESKAARKSSRRSWTPNSAGTSRPVPGGDVYHGLESVGRDFGPLMEKFDLLYPMGEEYFADAEGHVFALGHYHTVTRNGKSADVRFVHIWTARDGKLVKLQQAGDSLVLHQALDG